MLRNIYFIPFHSLIRYGIILWGEEIESVRVLKMQQKGQLVQLKGYIKESCVGQFLKSYRFSQ